MQFDLYTQLKCKMGKQKMMYLPQVQIFTIFYYFPQKDSHVSPSPLEENTVDPLRVVLPPLQRWYFTNHRGLFHEILEEIIEPAWTSQLSCGGYQE
jgi:hypothetical protein